MRKTVFIILLSFFLIPLYGQIAVESFRLLENDLTANTHGMMETDQNGEIAALIKVVTTQRGFSFDNGILGIVKVVPQPAEYWVYVPRKTQKITISHPDLGILRDYFFNIPIEGARTYELKLTTGQVITTVRKTTTQYLSFKVTPPNASIYIDGELQGALNSEGEFFRVVTLGSHSYRVEAYGYKSEAGVVEVTAEKSEPHVINLKSVISTLTLFCPDEDAEIILNKEVKGKGRWTGQIPPGLYIAEAHHFGFYNTVEEISLGELEEKTVTLNTPSLPIYGTLRVESVPMGAVVFVDDKDFGETPCFIDESAKLQVGKHKLMLYKEDYNVYATTITLKEDEETRVSGIHLSNEFEGTILSVPDARLYIDDEEMGITPYTGTLRSGDYRLRLEHKGYVPFDDTIHLSASDPVKSFELQSKKELAIRRKYESKSWLRDKAFYFGAEAHAIGLLAAEAVMGFYIYNVNAEFRFRYPFTSTGTAYFNWPETNGISKPSEMDVKCGYGFSGLMGYGIQLGKWLRFTPSAGLRYTSVMGATTLTDIREQKTFVLSYVGALKAEYAFTPFVSLVVTPEYSIPFGKDTFITSFENALPTMKGWYGGFGINAGIHFNF